MTVTSATAGMPRWARRLLRSHTSVAGIVIVSVLIVVGVFGPLLIGDDGLLPTHLDDELAPPGSGALLGRAENGVDVLTALIWGARVSLLVSFGTTLVSATIGLLYGAVSGFAGGHIDALMMRIVDVLLAFPGILLAIYIAAVLPPRLLNVVLALAATGWVGYARLARAQVLEIREREFVTAARALGARPWWILKTHVIPNILGPMIVLASFGLSTAILAEAALSFLGLGVPPGTPSWGALLDEGAHYLLVAPHLSIFPGVCIAASVLGFNFLGDGLRDVLDTRASLEK
jgi:peptide/nickel transport system permease protein